jgi:hypothetical protein
VIGGVRRSAAELGIDLADGRPEWASWRSYANGVGTAQCPRWTLARAGLWTGAQSAGATEPKTNGGPMAARSRIASLDDPYVEREQDTTPASP